MKKNNINYQNPWVLFAILMGAVILGSFLVFVLYNKKIVEKFGTSKVSIEYYCMSGCHFCEQFDSTWEDFTKFVDNSKTELPYTVVKYNISQSGGKERGEKFNINSAPTIIAVKNDAIVDTMAGARTLDNLKTFATGAANK